MTQVTDLFDNEVSAQRIHAELTHLLAPELDKTSWIEFTALALRHLPALNGKGRPSAEAIAASFVGRLGFKSWKEYVEASPDKGGLGWSATSWKRFKEAYALVQSYSWLTQADLTPDQIRVLGREYGDDWPDTLSEHRKRQADKAQAREEAKAQAEAEKAKQLADLARLPQLESEVQSLQSRLESQAKLHQRIGSLQADLKAAIADKTASYKRIQDLQATLKKHQEMGFLAHLIAAFRALK